jgi:hypothetical protein
MFFPFENELIFETPPEGLPVGGGVKCVSAKAKEEVLEII